jgi:hypothetical protein
MGYRQFRINFGYVEDTRFFELSVEHDQEFATVVEAIEDLRQTAAGYLRQEEEEAQRRVKKNKCCASADPFCNFCPTCGTKLVPSSKVGPYEISKFFDDLHSADYDSYHDALTYFEERGWNLGWYNRASEPPVHVRGAGRWMARENADDIPFMEWTLPDDTDGNTYEEKR